MLWFKLLIVVLVVKTSCGKFIIDRNPENKEIVDYVKSLIEDHDKKNQETNDVALFRLSNSGSSQQVDDLFEEISESIPKTTPVTFPALNEFISGRNLRASSFSIIVSDISSVVSQNLTPNGLKDLLSFNP